MADDAQRVTAVATTGTAVAALLLALRSRPAAASGGVSLVYLDEETLMLLAALAGAVEEIKQATASQSVIQGYPPNTATFTSSTVNCAVAGQAYRLPSVVVPEGYQLLLKGHPGNANLVYVGKQAPDAMNPNSGWPLAAGEMLGLSVKNSDAVWVSAVAAGDMLCCIVEQK